MIGRLYTISIPQESQSTSLTILEVASAADSVTMIERIWITQTDFDTSENLSSTTQRITTTGTGDAGTVVPFQNGDAAFGGTCKTNFSIEPTYTALKVILEIGFNVLSGMLWTPANDDEVIVVSPSALVGTNIDVAPSAAMKFSYGYTLREVGG